MSDDFADTSRSPLAIAFVGDVSLGEYYPSFGHGPRSFARSASVFADAKPTLNRADVVIGNLEAIVSDRSAASTRVEREALRADPDVVHQLRDAGFTVMQLANNHVMQHGDDAFDDTLVLLDEVGIRPVGLVGERLVTLERNGWRLGFMAASDVPDNTIPDQSRYQRLDEDFLARAEAAAPSVDALFVLLHWGLEASTSPLPYQRQIGARLRKAGVTAIIGSHPHLFYEIEREDNFVAAWSLGNFVFDLCWDERMLRTGVLELALDDTEGLSGSVQPMSIEANGCRPVPAGPRRALDTKVTRLYDLGEAMRWQPLRKVGFVLFHLARGDSVLKCRFVIEKTTSLAGKFRRLLFTTRTG